MAEMKRADPFFKEPAPEPSQGKNRQVEDGLSRLHAATYQCHRYLKKGPMQSTHRPSFHRHVRGRRTSSSRSSQQRDL
jgi:hypothetical protein